MHIPIETPFLPQRAMSEGTEQLIPGVSQQRSLGNKVDDTEKENSFGQ